MTEKIYPLFIGGPHDGQRLPQAFEALRSLPQNFGHIGPPSVSYRLHHINLNDTDGKMEQWFFYMAADTDITKAEEVINLHQRSGPSA